MVKAFHRESHCLVFASISRSQRYSELIRGKYTEVLDGRGDFPGDGRATEALRTGAWYQTRHATAGDGNQKIKQNSS